MYVHNELYRHGNMLCGHLIKLDCSKYSWQIRKRITVPLNRIRRQLRMPDIITAVTIIFNYLFISWLNKDDIPMN